MLFITLPSGRRLSYVKPQIGVNRFGGESVTYMGVDGTKHWSRIESYGPKFCENITQAISRDILCHAMRTLSYCRIVANVKHFFTLLGKKIFTRYGNQFFTSSGKEFFTSYGKKIFTSPAR